MCEEIFEKYPTLELILLGGVISKKMCRSILNIDRWLMDDLYTELLLKEAIVGVANSSFKASEPMVQFLRKKRGYE